MVLVQPHLDADLYYLIERMTIYVDPKPVGMFLTSPNLITEIKVKKSVQDTQMAMEKSTKLKEWVEKNNQKREEAQAEDKMGQPREEPESK